MDSLAARAVSNTRERTRARTHTTHAPTAISQSLPQQVMTRGGEARFHSHSTLREKAAWVLLHIGHDLELAASLLPQSLSPGIAKTFRAAVITE